VIEMKFRRWVSGAMGLVILFAGLLKAADIELFMAQIKAYGIVTDPLLLLISAWGLVALQCTVGSALLVDYRPDLTLPAAMAMWFLFLLGTGWASWTGATDECGCFGALLERSPQYAFVENVVFLALTLFAWSKAGSNKGLTRPFQRYTVVLALIGGVFLPLAFGVPISATINPGKDRPYLKTLEDLEIAGADAPKLVKGAHILFLLSTDCMHCLETLPFLDALAEEESLPLITGLCPNSEEERRSFTEQFQPAFPLGGISRENFWALLSMGELPRVMLIREGSLIKVWDNGVVPEADEIAALLGN